MADESQELFTFYKKESEDFGKRYYFDYAVFNPMGNTAIVINSKGVPDEYVSLHKDAKIPVDYPPDDVAKIFVEYIFTKFKGKL
jgi:hypothetical protein